VEWNENFLGQIFNHICINAVYIKDLHPNSAKGNQNTTMKIPSRCI